MLRVALEKVREIRAPDAGTPRSALTPDGAARLKRRLNALGAVTMAAEVGLVAVNAALAQEGFRRPKARRRVRLR